MGRPLAHHGLTGAPARPAGSWLWCGRLLAVLALGLGLPARTAGADAPPQRATGQGPRATPPPGATTGAVTGGGGKSGDAGATGATHEPTPAEQSPARRIFATGREAYMAGRYLEAVEAFERVFAMTGHPVMLVNVGNAWARLDETQRAVAAYRQYLGLLPDAPERLELEHRIAELEARASGETPTPQAPAPPPSGLLLGRTWTWVAAGGAVLSLGAAWLLWTDTSGRYDTLSRTCGASPEGCPGSDIASVSSGVTLTNVAVAVGAASALGAAVLWFVEAPEQAPDAPPSGHVELTAGPGGLHLCGSF